MITVLLVWAGSSAVGAKLGELCGRYIKPACMELGGKAPFIVLEDADVQAAAQCAAFGGFVNSVSAPYLRLNSAVHNPLCHRVRFACRQTLL